MTNQNNEQHDEDHADFDGIKENDNPIPTWFNFILFGTIGFAVSYMAYYHFIKSGTPVQDAYLASVAPVASEESASKIDFTKLMADAQTVENGKQTYNTNCAACHGSNAQGGIGSNLTDNFWIHGDTYEAVTNVIEEGVSDKGMPAWKSILGEKKIQEIVAYLGTIQDSNPSGAKGPEGTEGKLH